MFTPPELTKYLHDHIPVTAAMGLEVRECSWGQIEMRFPLAPNLNHNRTAFGGSLSSALMMAGWAMVHNRLRHHDLRTTLVVSRSETRFLKPVEEDFIASCEFNDDASWEHFCECLERKGRAKLRLLSSVHAHGDRAATMNGAFVSILPGVDGDRKLTA